MTIYLCSTCTIVAPWCPGVTGDDADLIASIAGACSVFCGSVWCCILWRRARASEVYTQREQVNTKVQLPRFDADDLTKERDEEKGPLPEER